MQPNTSETQKDAIEKLVKLLQRFKKKFEYHDVCDVAELCLIDFDNEIELIDNVLAVLEE